MNVAEFDNEGLSKAISGTKPVIVDFWADWCMPCRMMAPVFEDVSKDYSGKLGFAKIHTVDFPEAAEQHKVEGIPCLVMFEGGKEKGRIVGYMTKQQLKSRIDSLLPK